MQPDSHRPLNKQSEGDSKDRLEIENNTFDEAMLTQESNKGLFDDFRNI